MSAATQKQTTTQLLFLTILRILIGWHFLYEGVSKMLIPNWSAASYLENARWIFAGIFHGLAANPSALAVVNFLNIWGLTLIGLGLILGALTRTASLFGALMLLMYYVANPPFVGVDFGLVTEGHYMFVNKNLIEMMTLVAISLFPTGQFFGLDKFIKGEKKTVYTKTVADGQPISTLPSAKLQRREMLKYLTTIPILGGFAYGAYKKYNWEKINAITGATIKVSDTTIKDLKGELPKGKLGTFDISRVIMGGNLIGGWSHSRDLIYVSSLFKAYNTERKVFETLQIAEKAGINTINIGGGQHTIINKYKRIYGSTLQMIQQVHPTREDLYTAIDTAIDNGVDIIQIQGNCTDWRVSRGEMDVLEKALAYIQKQGYVNGIGAHSIQALEACEKAGLETDFYMKTLHHDNYWSAHPKQNRIPFTVDGAKSKNHNEFHDNMFCLFPQETVDFINKSEKPFIGFKVLAGGAIHPKDGFRFAFESGSDFICVGMFDYQIVDDVNIALDVLADLPKRTRPWYA